MAKYQKKRNGEGEAPLELSYWEEGFLLSGQHDFIVNWTPEETEAAWWAHRDHLLEKYSDRGYRPKIFWKLEHPAVNLEDYESELDALVDLGLASPKEVAVYHGKDMFDSDRETAEFYISRPDQQAAFNRDRWGPLVEEYKRLFPDWERLVPAWDKKKG